MTSNDIDSVGAICSPTIAAACTENPEAPSPSCMSEIIKGANPTLVTTYVAVIISLPKPSAIVSPTASSDWCGMGSASRCTAIRGTSSASRSSRIPIELLGRLNVFWY